jgi:pimeloyl-ACP methyl ester carboxylesterase
VNAPEIRYTQSGDVSIAYAISGEGPVDIVFVHGYMSNLEVEWEDPGHVAFFAALASAARVIRFDRRGSGLSDRVRDVPTLEARMDDVRAVMDAAESPRAVLVATFEAASMAMLFSGNVSGADRRPRPFLSARQGRMVAGLPVRADGRAVPAGVR